MKRLLLLLLCLTLPVFAEEPECGGVAHECLVDFLQAWADDNHDEMLTLCSPAWRIEQAAPEQTLFLLLRNRTAAAWNIGDASTDGDDWLYVVDVQLDDHSGREPQWYRFSLRLTLEDGTSYVVPDGLAAGEKTDEPETYMLPEAGDAASTTDDLGAWWHEAGAWNHAGDPDMWAEHNVRFAGFMDAWMARDMEAARSYLTPGWAPDTANPEWEFQRRFYIYAPWSYTIKGVVVGEDTRRVTYTVQIIDATPDYRPKEVTFSVDVYWDAGVWYIDPAGLPEVEKW